MSQPIHSVFSLSASEKLQLVEDLWDDIALSGQEVPVHPWQIEELERRKRNLEQNPSSALEWSDIQKRVRERFNR